MVTMSFNEQAIVQNKQLSGVCENIAEISSQFIVQLQEITGWSRGEIIHNCIIPWAVEAENAYASMSEEERDEMPYFDFIDSFTEKKMAEDFGTKALSECPPITVVFNDCAADQRRVG